MPFTGNFRQLKGAFLITAFSEHKEHIGIIERTTETIVDFGCVFPENLVVSIGKWLISKMFSSLISIYELPGPLIVSRVSL